MNSNTITLRKYFIWNSQWFCDYNYYNLLFEDLKINNYLQSIFTYLSYPTSNYIIHRHVYKIIIQSNIHVMLFFNKYFKYNKLMFFVQRHKNFLINNFVFKKSIFFLFKRVSFLLYFYLYNKKINANNINNILNINISNKLNKKNVLLSNINNYLVTKKNIYLYINRNTNLLKYIYKCNDFLKNKKKKKYYNKKKYFFKYKK